MAATAFGRLLPTSSLSEQPMSKPAEQSSFDYYTEHAKPVYHGYQRLRYLALKAMMKWVPYVAIVYGAVTLSAYYFVVGSLAAAFFWWLEHRPPAEPDGTNEPEQGA
jgi:hypothetical protein